MKLKNYGFTLIELMIVVVIIAFLSILTVPNLMKFLYKAKRTEAYINLGSLAIAQKMYFAQNGEYTNILGPEGLNWSCEKNINYTYGFTGQENKNYFQGNLKAAENSLSGSLANKNKFIIYAAADIDGDGKLDILSIDQDNQIKIVQDDLA